MKKPLPAFLELARILGQHGLARYGKALECDYLGLPIPAPRFDGLRIALLFARTSKAPGSSATSVHAPSHVVELRADRGTFVELRAVTPSSFGFKGEADAPLGELVRPPGESEARALSPLYDAVLPLFAVGPIPLGPERKRAINELKAAFMKAAEPSLVPYYRAWGKSFFSWLDRAG